MTILCLTGWQQQAGALSVIAPRAQHFDYAAYDDRERMFARMPPEPDLAIGWSLGGLLLAHAVSAGHTKPGEILLIGAPFQYIADSVYTHGVDENTFRQFRQGYVQRPEETLAQFHMLAGLGDSNARRIIRTLGEGLEIAPNGLYWLDALAKLSCASLDFSAFPRTIIVHGSNDNVVSAANAEIFKKHLPDGQTVLWEKCGHAPHLHDTQALRRIVEEHV